MIFHYNNTKQQEKYQVYFLINNMFIGYAGYVKSIKPENLYANTYGKITLNIA